MSYRKKLIEVALPLEAINRASAREKSIRHGHPSTLHLWWARRPLAACRAVLFAQLVDDPSEHPEEFPTPEAQQAERQRLFRLIEELVKWENTNNEDILRQARAEIRKSAGGDPPPLLDPFCGGGSIPLEAQRLGLEAHASDLNPVAVLITKALIEIPLKFAGRPPVNPTWKQTECKDEGWQTAWTGAKGLAEDIRYYGKWMRDEAERRIGHLYPKVRLPAENGGGEATVIGWLWARTVASPNPACGGAHVPLVRSFMLSAKKTRQAWVEPVIDRISDDYRFEVRSGKLNPQELDTLSTGTKTARGAKFACLLSGEPISDVHVLSEAKAGRMGSRLMAIVAEGATGRAYVAPAPEHERMAQDAQASWLPEQPLPYDPRHIAPLLYGFRTFADLFTKRQLASLSVFSELIASVREKVLGDAAVAGLPADQRRDGGNGCTAYADAIATYLGLGVSRLVNRSCTLCFWDTTGENIQQVFARQAMPMTWDFVEGNPFSNSSGSFASQLNYLAQVVASSPIASPASAEQADARLATYDHPWVICTDPPYYDNIGYADLSDFFYVWLRRALQEVYPDLFAMLLTPKAEELIATPYRFDGNRLRAKSFFEDGLGGFFDSARQSHLPDYPMVLFYAFKQSETDVQGVGGDRLTTSTGWETMLQALLKAGFTVTGTWPVRTELIANLKRNVGALASSIVIVCRTRAHDAPQTTRLGFLKTLKNELPSALDRLREGNIAPVDLAQAAIGPGMAVFSRYGRVLEADGSPMRVRMALALINQVLDEHFAAREGEYDPSTRWALAWFEQYGFAEGPFGVAETLSKAKNTAVSRLAEVGLLMTRGGQVRLLRRAELAGDSLPASDQSFTVWHTTHHLACLLLDRGGERAAADLLKQVGTPGEAARDLAYHLYTICDRKNWSQDALAYNSLVVAWPEITRLASESTLDTETRTQPRLLGEG